MTLKTQSVFLYFYLRGSQFKFFTFRVRTHVFEVKSFSLVLTWRCFSTSESGKAKLSGALSLKRSCWKLRDLVIMQWLLFVAACFVGQNRYKEECSIDKQSWEESPVQEVFVHHFGVMDRSNYYNTQKPQPPVKGVDQSGGEFTMPCC